MQTTHAAARKVSGVATAVALMLLSSSVFAKNSHHSELTPGDIAFMKTVQEGNIAEVGAGKIVVKRAKSSDTRKIAQMIVEDHSKGRAALANIASMKHISLPTAPNAKHKMFAAKLSQLPSPALDKFYVDGQLNEHTKVVSLFKHEATTVKDADLKKFVLETLPAIQGHTEMLAKAHQMTAMHKMADMHKM